ncbi:MAG TPA: outer membrane lipoprotein carrier protein LolA [Thermoanaerobaculia bacterium]|jgi:outer membrane lipoprotein-sorting protein
MIRFLLLLLVVAPQSSEPAQSALARTAARYNDGAAHAADFVQIYTPSGFTTSRRESGVIWIQAPRRLRFDYSAPEKKTFTYDDGEGRFYSTADRQLDVKKLSPEEQARLPIVFLKDPAELAREYTLSSEAAPDGGQRIGLVPRRSRPELARLDLVLGSEEEIRELSYSDDAGNRTEFRFEKWRSEKPRPAADYRVEGPKGTRVVE